MAETAPVASESFADAVAADKSRSKGTRAERDGKRGAFKQATGTSGSRPAARRGDGDAEEPLRRLRPKADDGQDAEAEGEEAWQEEFNALLDPTAGDAADDGEDEPQGGEEERRPAEPDGQGIAGLTVKQLAAVRRANTLPDSVLEKMTAKELAAYAEDEIQRQSATDTLLRQKPSGSQEEPGRDTKDSEGKDSGGQVAAPDQPKPVDLEALVRPQLSVLGIDEADMPKLIAPLKAVQEQLQAQVQSAIAQAKASVAESTQAGSIQGSLMLQLAQRAIIGELTQKWARLRDPDVLKDVQKEAVELLREYGINKDDVFGGLMRTVDDAARRKLGPPDSETAVERRGSSAHSDSRTSSRPDSSRNGASGKKKLTDLQKKQRIFKTVTGESFPQGQRADLTLRDARIS